MLCTISAWSGGRGETGDWGALQGTGGLAITYQQWSAVICGHSLSMAVWSDVITHRYCFCRVSSSLRLCCLRMWIWSSQASFAVRKGQVWEQPWEEGNNVQYSGFPHTPCPCTIFTCLRTPPHLPFMLRTLGLREVEQLCLWTLPKVTHLISGFPTQDSNPVLLATPIMKDKSSSPSFCLLTQQARGPAARGPENHIQIQEPGLVLTRRYGGRSVILRLSAAGTVYTASCLSFLTCKMERKRLFLGSWWGFSEYCTQCLAARKWGQ